MTHRSTSKLHFASIGALLIAACSPGAKTSQEAQPKFERVTTSSDRSQDKHDDVKTVEQGERWTPNDNPAEFAPQLEYEFAKLPTAGTPAQAPWAASYWPVYEDSINHLWDGPQSESAAAKYGRAFNVTGVEDAVSRNHGIDNNTGAKECASTADCNASLSEKCAKRVGAEKGRCIPSWWGICHAWAPASIMVPEPKYPVTLNGVTFKVNDIKALVTLAHDRVTSEFVSGRCEQRPDEDPRDGDGRSPPKCRDTNPGTLHILLANYLGIKGQSFVYDRTWNHEVWNQPLRSFRVTSSREVPATEANQLIGVALTGGVTTTKSVTVAKSAWDLQEVAVQAGTKLLVKTTGSGDADLYVQWGQAPTTGSNVCASSGGSSDEECSLEVPAGTTKAYVGVYGYSDTATVEVTITAGASAPSTYKFNADAKKLLYVTSEVDYIAESPSSLDGNLASSIDTYTHTDRYQYILELDAAGKIIGGEYVGASKKAHPDFLWLPTGIGRSSVAGGKITWANVKSLLDQSLLPPGTNPAPGSVKTVTENLTVGKGAWKHFGPFAVAPGKTLTARTSGSGDADLYVRKGAQPTSTAYDCRPYSNGSSESCDVAGGGPVFVSVYGYAESSVTLEIRYEEGSGSVTPPADTSHLNTSGNVAQGGWQVFEVNVQAGKQIVVKTTSAVDVDLYVKLDSAPTTSSFLQRAWTVSGNETITLTPASSGVLFVGVHGYAAGAFTLTTSDN